MCQRLLPHDWLALLGMSQAWWILLSIMGLGCSAASISCRCMP